MTAQTFLAPAPPPPGASQFAPPARRANRVASVVRGRTTDPAWVRPSVLALLVATAVLYLWGLGASGWANSFYSAAAQAGSASWKAMFFGSSDAANSITVDKPPAALWIMALSVRIFGLSSWSLLVPQALEGVAAVGLLYLAVRRTSGPAAGLIAGAVLATTPVAALMFRFNNPDALLVLLMVAGRLLRCPGAGNGLDQVAAAGRRADRLRLPDQDAAGAAGGAGLRAGLPGRRAQPGARPGSASCWPPVPPWSSRPAGGSPSCRWCRPPTVPTSAARSTTRSSN